MKEGEIDKQICRFVTNEERIEEGLSLLASSHSDSNSIHDTN